MAPRKKIARTRRKTFLTEWRGKKIQEEIAELAGVSRTTLSRVENGVTPYNQDLLERLAEIYNCEPADLLSVNPLEPGDHLRLLYNRLLAAPPELQMQVSDVIDVLLKGGSFAR
jgi:transcriptional regulator with XRE-family HTH domain